MDATRDMADLSDVYPAFDLEVHKPLIDQFRAKNPYCSIEQAFRAIATPDELAAHGQVPATAVPPVLDPGNGSVEGRRYAQPTQPRSDPAAEVAQEQAQFEKLARSDDPNERKLAHEMSLGLLAKRLGR